MLERAGEVRNMFDDDLFGFVPDIDGDGNHDLLHFLILESILEEEEKELEAYCGVDDDNDDIFDDIDDIDDWDNDSD